MIEKTNNIQEFLEKHKDPIFIYGAGKYGKWVGVYMGRCGISFEGYLDKACDSSIGCEVKLWGVSVFHPQELKKYKGQRIRIIIAVHAYESVLADLEYFAEQNELYCLVPCYNSLTYSKKMYDINFLLGYFRRRLIKVKVPTIISNDCHAGFMYRMLGLPLGSPTINTACYPEDFIKICENPMEYLDREMMPDGYTIENGKCCPAGKVGDISISLRHDLNIEDGVDRWNTLKRWVDYNNLIYVMSDAVQSIAPSIQERFMNLDGKKLLILTNGFYTATQVKNEKVIYMSKHWFFHPEIVCEEYFDILGWINGEF